METRKLADKEHNDHVLNDIPEEIGAYIFSFLNPKDSAVATTVCTSFNLFANNDYQWMLRVQQDFDLDQKELDKLRSEHASYKDIYHARGKIKSFLLVQGSAHAGETPFVSINRELKAQSSDDHIQHFMHELASNYAEACLPAWKWMEKNMTFFGVYFVLEFNIDTKKAQLLLASKQFNKLLSHCKYIHCDPGSSEHKLSVAWDGENFVESGEALKHTASTLRK